MTTACDLGPLMSALIAVLNEFAWFAVITWVRASFLAAGVRMHDGIIFVLAFGFSGLCLELY